MKDLKQCLKFYINVHIGIRKIFLLLSIRNQKIFQDEFS